MQEEPELTIDPSEQVSSGAFEMSDGAEQGLSEQPKVDGDKVPKLQLAPKHGDTSAPSSARSGAGTPRNANPPGPKTAGVGLRLTDNHPHRAVQVVQNGPGRYTVSDLHAAPSMAPAAPLGKPRGYLPTGIHSCPFL